MIINGITVATPKHGGVVITDEPIWASNTGRSSTGKMIGDIVAWKTTISVTWPPLSFEDIEKIRNAVINAGPFFKIKYYDFNTDSSTKEPVLQEKTVYASNIPRTMYSLAEGYQRHTDVTITFVEQ